MNVHTRGTPATAIAAPRSVTHQELLANRLIFLMFCLAVATLLGGCGMHQNYSSLKHNAISLTADDLSRYGVAFISPSMTTGQEEDKQVLALVFADTLKKQRPDVSVIPLPQALGAINRAGLADSYNAMFKDYRETGIFNRKTLRRVGDAIHARYLVQLNLANFVQDTRGRFSMLGMRISQTSHANIRLFVQIWDSQDGSIAWEGVEELNLAEETGKENTITFTSMVEHSAQNLIALLPKADSPQTLSKMAVAKPATLEVTRQ